MISSFASIFGGATQGNYSAANSFQNAFNAYRISQGLKSMSINIGLFEGSGYVLENRALFQGLQRSGFRVVRMNDLLKVMERFCFPTSSAPGIDSPDNNTVFIGVPNPLELATRDSPLVDRMQRAEFYLLSTLHNLIEERTTLERQAASTLEGYLEQLTAAIGIGEDPIKLVTSMLTQKILRVTNIPEGDVEPGKPLFHIGVDFLTAAELRNWILKSFGVEIGTSAILSGKSAADVAGSIVIGITKDKGGKHKDMK